MLPSLTIIELNDNIKNKNVGKELIAWKYVHALSIQQHALLFPHTHMHAHKYYKVHLKIRKHHYLCKLGNPADDV